MLRRCVYLLHVVSRSSIAFASTELNKMLAAKDGGRPVPPDELKRFLSRSVTPILEGTSLDRKDGDVAPAQRMLAQLVRDCAFSANALRARPEGRFVRTLVDCIIHDASRMHFTKRLSSTQASKVIELLCRIGVRDANMYPLLVAKLDYYSLKDVARVMFALAEAELHELNVTVVVPLYCGEQWMLTHESPPDASVRQDNSSCNTFDAVRVLRALSKSTRAAIEERRKQPHAHMGLVPLDSIAQLRSQLLQFILVNADTLRGAHWTNIARALVNFPAEAQLLSGGLAYSPAPVITAALEDASSSAQSGVRSGSGPMCNELALFCIGKVFQYAEGRAPIPEKHSLLGPSPSAAFDLTQLDLVKLIPLLRQVPCSAALREERFAAVFKAVGDGLQGMQFSGLVQLIHTLRQLEGSSAFPADAIERVAQEAGDRLVSMPVEDVLAEIPMRRIEQFASQLTAFRVRACPGFVSFIVSGAQLLRPFMSPETAAVLLSALTTVVGKQSNMALTPSIRCAVMVIVESSASHGRRGTAAAPRDAKDSLLALHPLPCIKILRSMVLMDVLPPAAVVKAMFGEHGDALLNGQLQQGGALLLFDLSRSLTHFCRQARTAASPAPPAEDLVAASIIGPCQRAERRQSHASDDESVEALLWSRGLVHTVFALLEQHTNSLARTYINSIGVNIPISSYVPVCWRSSMESAAVYVDVALDASQSFDRMATRLIELHPQARTIAAGAVGLLASQCANLREAADSPATLHRLFSQASFSSNATVHTLAFLLMWEYLLYQAAWVARRVLHRTSTSSEDCTTSDNAQQSSRELAEQVLQRKSDYDTFLKTPFSWVPVRGVTSLTPLQALGLVFSAKEVPALERLLSPGVADEPMLSRADVFEITTHLPFAISLVLEPGPVNEFFSSRSLPLILGSEERSTDGAAD